MAVILSRADGEGPRANTLGFARQKPSAAATISLPSWRHLLA
ncbi:MAG: hypothetical protein AVDCRST_MAG42-2446 [uncultured Chthoniobacterales bacterium]|uniref:Uncharacterized protein n=1 Tax=uncultured Chthoniobacterales bacterium TaxID=1836801 RepID=A0A6J4IFB7_9BACT|nr:MAG: hypothetical protein AVDCRST_MAG42-2446 [uncultured Chthoniobacterales bacterium]